MATSTPSSSRATQYRGKTRGEGKAYYVWRRSLLLAVLAALGLCFAGVIYLLLFTHPHSDGNLPAFYALIGFGSFFGLWSGGYLLRRLAEPYRAHPADCWPCTRQALLGAIGIMISLLLAPTGRLGVPAVLLIAVGLVGAEAALTWRAMRSGE